jgi:hypothetical protein
MCITIFDVKLAENKEFLIFHPMCMCFLCAKSSSLRAINHRIMCLMWTFFQWPSTLKNLVGVLTSCCVLSGQATNTNFIVFGLTRSGLEPTIYHTRGEHANQILSNAHMPKSCLYVFDEVIYNEFLRKFHLENV